MPRGRSQTLKVTDKIVAAAERGVSPPAILKELMADPELKDEKGSYIGPVDVRTVRSIIREHMPKDSSEPWALADASVDEARFVLPELAAIIRDTNAEVTSISIAMATYILKLKGAFPDLPPFSAYRLALAYLKREEEKIPTVDLDIILAFAPWRNREHAYAYKAAVEKSHLPSPKDGLHLRLWADGQIQNRQHEKEKPSGTRKRGQTRQRLANRH